MKHINAAQRLNPFPGLRPFRSDEHHLFFGREQQTSALLQLLRTNRFLAVVGTSGSGKSSLVRAGMIAELYGGTMTQAGSTWEVILLRPGGSPIENLARALIDADLYDAEDRDTLPRLLATLSRSRFGLVEAVKQSDRFEPGSNLLVVVDQFEELFRFRQQGAESEETAAAFVNLLLTASEQAECPIYVTITMRSDYLGDCSEIPGLAEAVNQGEYLIPRLLRDQKRDAIEKPIRVGGAKISPLLVQRLLNDVGDDPDQLPVLQHALMRMWDAWSMNGNQDRPIDFDDFEATGGFASALSNHADEIYNSLAEDSHRMACEKIFKSLTEKGKDNRGIRRPTRMTHLQAIADTGSETVMSVLNAFRAPGVTFLMPGAEIELNDRTVLDLSHESLMRNWQRLRGWVEEEAQSARIFQRLLDTARLWGDGNAGLFRNPDLQIALSWREHEAPNADWAAQYGGHFDEAIHFLEASHAEVEAERSAKEAARQQQLDQARQLAEAQRLRLEQQQRSAHKLRVMIGGLAVVALLAGIASIIAWRAHDQADELRIVSAQEAKQAKQNAKIAEQAEQAMKRTAIQAAEDRNAALRESYRFSIKLAASMLQGDGEAQSQVADILWETQPELRGWEWGHLMAQCPLEQWSLRVSDGDLRAITTTADGRFLVTATMTGLVTLWDLKARQPVWQVESGPVYKLSLDPSHRFVAVSTADDTLPQFKILDLATGGVLHQSPQKGTADIAFSASGSEFYTLDNSGKFSRIVTSSWEQRAQALIQSVHPSEILLSNCVIFVDQARDYVGVFRQYADVEAPKFQFFDAQTMSAIENLNELKQTAENVRSPSTPVFNSALGEVVFTFLHTVSRKQTDGTITHLCEHSGYVSHLTIDPESGTILTATSDGTVQLTEVDGQSETVRHGAPIVGLATLPGGRFITAGADGLVKCWDVRTSTLAFKIDAPLPSSASANLLRFVNGGKQLLYQNWDRKHHFMYDMSSLHFQHFQRPDGARSNSLFPVSRPLSNELICDQADGLLIFQLGNGGVAEEATRTIPIPCPRSAAIDAAGRVLVVASMPNASWPEHPSFPSIGIPIPDVFPESHVAVFDAESGTQLPSPHVQGAGPVDVNASGTRAAVSTNEALQVWETASGRLLNKLDGAQIGPIEWFSAPVFHPDGELIAVIAKTENTNSQLILWDSNRGEAHSTIESAGGITFRFSRFSTDGDRLFVNCSDERIRIFDWRLKKELIELTGGNNVEHLDTSPDGLTIAYAGWGPSLLIAKSLPWQGAPRNAAFYDAVDELLDFTARVALGVDPERSGFLFTNRSNKRVQVDVVTANKNLMSLAVMNPGDELPLPSLVPSGTEFLFIDLETSQRLGSYTKTAFPREDTEGPIRVTIIQPNRDTTAEHEELRGDVAVRQGRLSDAISHYKASIGLRTKTILEDPSNAVPQARLVTTVRKYVAAAAEENNHDACADELQQSIAFWQELLKNPTANPLGWQYLLRLQLQLLDIQISNREKAAEESLTAVLSFWASRLVQNSEDRRFRHGLSEVFEKLPAVYPSGIDDKAVGGIVLALNGAAGSESPTAVVAVAQLAHKRKRFDFAARLWMKALSSDPTLNDDHQHRFSAACSAAMAGCGHGNTESELDEEARFKLRAQAFEWLRADADAWAKVNDDSPEEQKLTIAHALRQWTTDPDLAGIRDEEELTKLPDEQQRAFRQLWVDVAELQKRF